MTIIRFIAKTDVIYRPNLVLINAIHYSLFEKHLPAIPSFLFIYCTYKNLVE